MTIAASAGRALIGRSPPPSHPCEEMAGSANGAVGWQMCSVGVEQTQRRLPKPPLAAPSRHCSSSDVTTATLGPPRVLAAASVVAVVVVVDAPLVVVALVVALSSAPSWSHHNTPQRPNAEGNRN